MPTRKPRSLSRSDFSQSCRLKLPMKTPKRPLPTKTPVRTGRQSMAGPGLPKATKRSHVSQMMVATTPKMPKRRRVKSKRRRSARVRRLWDPTRRSPTWPANHPTRASMVAKLLAVVDVRSRTRVRRQRRPVRLLLTRPRTVITAHRLQLVSLKHNKSCSA